MRSLMIQGTSSGSGKTVLVAALCRIFAQKGLAVAPFKSQNMSSFAYAAPGFEISRAQAIQAIAAGCEITPDLNPILLKPLGNYASMVYLEGRRYKRMHARDYYKGFVNAEGIRIATRALRRLQRSHDLVILEGAGSPAEINLQRYDIANMRMAKRADAAVILVSDIERGGSFASLAGTMSLLEKRHRELVRGFVLNKFRGSADVLRPGFPKLRRITGVPVIGTIPAVPIGLPEEDSLSPGAKKVAWTARTVSRIDAELDRLAKTVKSSLDMRSVERMIR